MNTDGTITSWDAAKNLGVIKAHDGRKFFFSKREWNSPKFEPEPDLIVTFEVSGTAALKISIVGRVSRHED
jgi:hypothetical protein